MRKDMLCFAAICFVFFTGLSLVFNNDIPRRAREMLGDFWYYGLLALVIPAAIFLLLKVWPTKRK